MARDQGVDPEALGLQMLAAFKERIAASLADAPQPSEVLLTYATRVESAGDLWELHGLLNEASQVADALLLQRYAPESLTDLSTYKNVVDELNRIGRLDSDADESIYSVVLSLPKVWIYELDFEAYFDPEMSGIGPAVVVYPHLERAMEWFLDVVLLVLQNGNSEQISTFSKHDRFIAQLTTVMDLIFNPTTELRLYEDLLETNFNGVTESFKQYLLGAQRFVWMHEYAHVFLGHDQAEPSTNRQELEREADGFSFEFLRRWGESEDDPAYGFRLAAGALATIVVIWISELRSGVGTSHPPAEARVHHAIDAAHIRYRRALLQFLASLQRTMIPTLLAYGVEVPDRWPEDV